MSYDELFTHTDKPWPISRGSSAMMSSCVTSCRTVMISKSWNVSSVTLVIIAVLVVAVVVIGVGVVAPVASTV